MGCISLDKVKRVVKRLWAMKHDFVEYTKEVVGTLAFHFHLYIMFVLARNTFPFLEQNSSKRRESKPFQKQY